MLQLQGFRIVVTRAAHQAKELARLLSDLGAQVLFLPAIEIVPPADPQPLLQAAARCNQYDWIVFTSVNAVQAFAAALPGETTCDSKIAAVGITTKTACEQQGWPVQLMPDEFIAESLVTAFGNLDLNGKRVLIPSAAVTRNVVPIELQKLGAQVDVVVAYQNVLPSDTEARAEAMLQDPYPDWILLASSSAVKNLIDLVGAGRLNRMRIATIGPATTATAVQLGLTVTAQASTHDAAGLISAITPVTQLIPSLTSSRL